MYSTLRLSGLLAFAGPFLLAQTYAGRLPSHFILCALYLGCLGVAGAAAYLCALDSQVSYTYDYPCASQTLLNALTLLLVTQLQILSRDEHGCYQC